MIVCKIGLFCMYFWSYGIYFLGYLLMFGSIVLGLGLIFVIDKYWILKVFKCFFV